jgi:hypothetical protein
MSEGFPTRVRYQGVVGVMSASTGRDASSIVPDEDAYADWFENAGAVSASAGSFGLARVLRVADGTRPTSIDEMIAGLGSHGIEDLVEVGLWMVDTQAPVDDPSWAVLNGEAATALFGGLDLWTDS